MSPQQLAIDDLARFAWSLYAQAAPESRNFVYSPYSIALASAMLSAGAAGATLVEIRSALRFSHVGAPLHAAQRALSRQLASGSGPAPPARTLHISNDLWLHAALRPEPALQNTLERHYGALVHSSPFDTNPEEARRAINRKVLTDTGKLIDDILPSGSIGPCVQLILTNAVFFKGRWEIPFVPSSTAPRPFTNLSGARVNVPTMGRQIRVRYAARPGYVALSIPYKDYEAELLLVVPDAGAFVPFVRALDADQIERMTLELREGVFNVFLPKFEIQTSFPLEEELARAGMIRAFDPYAAEFPLFAARTSRRPRAGASCPQSNIHVGQFRHKARVILDEDGTVAAAATAFSLHTFVSSAPPPLEIKVDRPFIFFIRDASGAVLFVGHVLDPR